MSDNSGGSRSATIRIAIPLLLLLIGSALVIAGWRWYQAADWVHPAKRAEFLLMYASYPLALGVVELLALVLLYKGRNAGRMLAAFVFAYAGYHAASEFWVNDELACLGGVARTAGRVASALAATGLLLLAFSLIRELLRGGPLVESNRIP